MNKDELERCPLQSLGCDRMHKILKQFNGVREFWRNEAKKRTACLMRNSFSGNKKVFFNVLKAFKHAAAISGATTQIKTTDSKTRDCRLPSMEVRFSGVQG